MPSSSASSVDDTYDRVVQFLDYKLQPGSTNWPSGRLQRLRGDFMAQLHEDRRLMREAACALSMALGQGLTDCYNDEDGDTLRNDVLVLERLERRMSETFMHESVRKELKPHVW